MDQVESLNNFLTETFSELSRRFKEFDKALEDVQPDDEKIKKKLESAFMCWEDINATVDGFKSNLSERNLIKESLDVPRLSFLNVGGRKRDSGIDTASSTSSGSPFVSANRLSAYTDSRESVSFNLQSTHSSVSDFNENTCEESSEPTRDETSMVYIHILPSNPNTDLSGLRQEIQTLSRSTLKTDNVELHIVPSDSFIGIPSRHSSVSTEGSSSIRPSRQISLSSEGLYSVRARFPSSNDSLAGAVMGMSPSVSSRIALEHTDSSDEQGSRFVSSSDSDISIVRNRVQLITTETQTDIENNMGASSQQDFNSVQTQTY